MPNRRHFIFSAAATSLTSQIQAQNKANRKLRVGVMGLSRGQAHIRNFAKITGVEVAYVCDVDSDRLAAGAKLAASAQNGREPKAVTDFRRILEDPSVDILSIAAPNFWHAPATILACDAGKHVYVEKPGSHNPLEAKLMVQAARRNNRKVQMGNQRRSAPAFQEGIEKIKSGAIGPLRYARCWYGNTRQSIGRGKQTSIPKSLDYDLWQGPAAHRPYQNNLIHYNWHWLWHYGGGELANNGVHALDIARWALDVDTPQTTSYVGGRYHFEDDQETPDTGDACYDFGNVGISWHGSSCLRRSHEKHPFVSLYGESGVVSFDRGGYQIYDLEGKITEENRPDLSDLPHFENLINAIRHEEALNAEIGDAQKSTMLCHLGNISYREGLQIKAMNFPEKYQTRDYCDQWRPVGA